MAVNDVCFLSLKMPHSVILVIDIHKQKRVNNKTKLKNQAAAEIFLFGEYALEESISGILKQTKFSQLLETPC